MPYRTIAVEQRGQIAWLTLNRPQAGNSIDRTLAGELGDACSRIDQQDDIRVLIVTGAGDAFCLGADYDELSSMSAAQLRKSNPLAAASTAVASVSCPVVAAINGDALGAGLELALACDLRLAAESARFGFPETSHGLIPGGGGTQRLPRLVGKGMAIHMILTAEPIDAREAYRIGLVSKAVLRERLGEEAEEIARRLASRAPIAVRYAKEAIGKGMDMTLEQGLRLEADLSFLLQTSEDRAEGIKAFLEKRTGEFKGK